MPFGTRIPQDSYYDNKFGRPTAALQRARHPYLVKNAVTGMALVGLTAAIYVYTLRVVGQDDFSDVPMPDAPVKNATSVPSTPSTSSTAKR